MDYAPVWVRHEPKAKPKKEKTSRISDNASKNPVTMRQRNRRVMDVNEVFQEFADGTSMHGVPRIINARSITARIFWTMICLGAFIMFFWQCGFLLKRYYTYPKKVNVEILQEPVPFPAVSVCNVDNMDFELAERLTEVLKEHFAPAETNATFGDAGLGNSSDYGASYANYEGGMPDFSNMDYFPGMEDYIGLNEPVDYGHEFINKYMAVLQKATDFMMAYAALNQDSKTSTIFTEAFSRFALPANLGIQKTAEGGIRQKDFIIDCRFMDAACSGGNFSNSFTHNFDPYYFNCFTFNPENTLQSRSMRIRGVDYGLSLVLFTGSAGQVRKTDVVTGDDVIYVPGTEESDSALASGRGARVVVHSPDTRPIPTAVGYDIPPGFSVTIGVKARQNFRIDGNHGNCTLNGTDSSLGTNYKYTLLSCQNNCIQTEIMRKCRCVDSRLSLPTDMDKLPFCFAIPKDVESKCVFPLYTTKECRAVVEKWKMMIECREQVYEEMTIKNPRAMETCRCYPPCEDLVYDSTYSLSTLPEDPKEQTAFILKIRKYMEGIEEPHRRTILEEKYHTRYNTSLEQGMMRHLARLNVHIADNNMMITTESPDYEPIRLVSDIGGQLGLWIGISVMTLFEVLQLIADVFRYLTSKGRHVGEKKVDTPNTISGNNRVYGNGDRFRIPESDIELPCEIDKLTTV